MQLPSHAPDLPLADRAQGLASHLVTLAELLADDGPLAYLRFNPDALKARLKAAVPAAQSLEDALDSAYAQHIVALAPLPFVQAFVHALDGLAQLPYAPQEHRQAAAAAAAMTPAQGLDPSARGADAPALYVLFCVQAQAYFSAEANADAAGT